MWSYWYLYCGAPEAQASSPEKYFLLFFSENIIHDIVMSTNAKIDTLCTQYKKQNTTIIKTSKDEIRTTFGILVFSWYRQNNHLETKEIWCPIFGVPFYRTAISKCQFNVIICYLKFNNPKSCEERKTTGKFALIRSVWDKFISYCGMHYSPHKSLTAKKQLLAFRRHHSFRIHIPKKLANCGLNFVMANNISSRYVFNAIPYLGKSGY